MMALNSRAVMVLLVLAMSGEVSNPSMKSRALGR